MMRTKLAGRTARLILGEVDPALPTGASVADRAKLVLSMLVSICSQYPFPERLTADQLDQVNEPPTPVEFKRAEDVREWIDAVREVANPISRAFVPRTNTMLEWFQDIGKTPEGLHEPDEVEAAFLFGPPRSPGENQDWAQRLVESRPHNVVFGLMIRLVRVEGLATEAERKLATLRRYEALMPSIPVRLLILVLGAAAFATGVLVPLVDPTASVFWTGWVPVTAYSLGLVAGLVLAVVPTDVVHSRVTGGSPPSAVWGRRSL